MQQNYKSRIWVRRTAYVAVWFRKQWLFQLNKRSRLYTRWSHQHRCQGRIYPQRGPCSEKMWGPFTSKKTGDFFGHYSRCSLGGRHYFGISGMQKIRRCFCGAAFLWGPCSVACLNPPRTVVASCVFPACRNINDDTRWPNLFRSRLFAAAWLKDSQRSNTTSSTP